MTKTEKTFKEQLASTPSLREQFENHKLSFQVASSARELLSTQILKSLESYPPLQRRKIIDQALKLEPLLTAWSIEQLVAARNGIPRFFKPSH